MRSDPLGAWQRVWVLVHDLNRRLCEKFWPCDAELQVVLLREADLSVDHRFHSCAWFAPVFRWAAHVQLTFPKNKNKNQPKGLQADYWSVTRWSILFTPLQLFHRKTNGSLHHNTGFKSIRCSSHHTFTEQDSSSRQLQAGCSNKAMDGGIISNLPHLQRCLIHFHPFIWVLALLVADIAFSRPSHLFSS